MTLTTPPGPEVVGAAAPSLPPELQRALADPQVVDSLTSLLGHADLLAVLVQGLDGMLRRSEVIGENLAGSMQDLEATVKGNEALEGGPDVAALLESALLLVSVLPTAAPGMARAARTGVVEKLFDSDLVSPEAVDQISLFARGLVRGSEKYETDPVKVQSTFSLLRLLKDPDVNRALSFVATIGKEIGRELAEPHSSASPSST